MGRSKVDYENMKVVFLNEPGEQAIDNYLKRTIDIQVKKYGKDLVIEALKELRDERC